MALKIENSVIAGIAVGTLVYGMYNMALPSVADARSLESNNVDLAAAEKTAEWTSAAVVAGVSLIARDPTIFVIGGTIMVALSWIHRHANAVNSVTQSVLPTAVPRVSQAQAPGQYATPKARMYEPTF